MLGLDLGPTPLAAALLSARSRSPREVLWHGPSPSSGTKRVWSAYESCVPFTRGQFHYAVTSHGHGPSTLSGTKTESGQRLKVASHLLGDNSTML